jgi:hypothetical protein
MIHQKLFSREDVNVVLNCCHDIISGGSMSQSRIRKALAESEDGAELLQRYSISQIITRLSYERKKRML